MIYMNFEICITKNTWLSMYLRIKYQRLLRIPMAQLSLIFTPKADYGTQRKELEGLVQAINTKLSSLEE